MNKYYYYKIVPEQPSQQIDQFYQRGTIETYCSDTEEETPISVGTYHMPIDLAKKFADFFDNLDTQHPMSILLNSAHMCDLAASRELCVDINDVHKSLVVDDVDLAPAKLNGYRRTPSVLDDEDGWDPASFVG